MTIMHYTVRKSGSKWHLTNQLGTLVGKYDRKAEACMTGRLLAGWRGTCVVVRR